MHLMKSPTPLISVRHAVGVMLALSAVFAIVLTAISIPSDDADAQTLSEEDMRAMRWWNSLDADQKVTAVLGEVADPVDPDNPTTAEQQVIDAATALENTYGDLDDATTHTPIANLTGRNATTAKGIVDEIAGTLYPAGDHLPANNENEMIGAIRGFQSVELWWNYLDCQEMRIAVGDGNLTGTEGEGYCQMYDDLDGAQKARVDKVGIAILGRAEGDTGSYSEAPNNRARAWWETLDRFERIKALYGDGIISTGDDFQDDVTTPDIDERFDERVERDYLVYAIFGFVAWGPTTRGLINDRWLYIYNNRGGPNTDGLDEVVHWWNSLRCTQKRIATGVSNEHELADEGMDFCHTWDDLEDDDAQANSNGRQAQVFALGRAVLGLTPLPQISDRAFADVEGWWETLDEDQKEKVVYGNPPMRVQYDDDGDTVNTPDDLTTDLTQADKDAVRKPYNLLGRIVVAADDTHLDTHLNQATVAMLQRNGMAVDNPNTHYDTDPNSTVSDYNVNDIVDAIANEIFDPPSKTAAMTSPPDSGTYVDAQGQSASISDDNDFNWPYNVDNLPTSVADWWESLDCRTKRMAVGEDNQYLNAEMPDTSAQDEPSNAKDAETSVYCRHFPGSADAVEDDPQTTDIDESNIISEKDQGRVEDVGMALLALSSPGRPSYNTAATGMPVISGVAQVGSQLTAMKGTINDVDDEGSITYKWFYGDASDYMDSSSIGEGSTYDLKPGDAGNTIKIVAFFKDSHRYPEMRASGVTTKIAGSPGEISRIEPAIRSVTVSSGDKVRLSVDIYGLQNARDNSLGATFGWTQDKDTSREESLEGTGREIVYTAPSSPGTYTVTAALGGGECQPDVEDDRDTACLADFTVQVRRISRPATKGPPVNPPGEIPTILTDSDGNQYEVFTPEDGGTFNGDASSLEAGPGVVPNSEIVGLRISEGGTASNEGKTFQRYSLGGNWYEISAVDASNNSVSSYALNDAIEVCIPLPDALRSNISDLAMVAINADDSLTVLSNRVRILASARIQVCGNISSVPSSVALGTSGSPAPLPTEVPDSGEASGLPETGGAGPSSPIVVFWILIVGLASIVVAGAMRRAGRNSIK